MFAQLLCLDSGDMRRLLPFFVLYMMLLSAFTLADGISLVLFIQRTSTDRLPVYYVAIALANLLLIGLYMAFAVRQTVLVFQLILLGGIGAFLASWIAITQFNGGPQWYGVLFVGREIAFTLTLMHFGTFLQEYFNRTQMNRVMPFIYSGGRVGGILGGMALVHLQNVELLDLTLLFVLLISCCMVGIQVIRLLHRKRNSTNDSHEGQRAKHDAEAIHVREQSLIGFLRFAWNCPLLFWLTTAAVLFVACRWFLNFQYNCFFSRYFVCDADMANFFGHYTQVALAISLLIQLLLVNRLVRWAGLGRVHLMYSILVLIGMVVLAVAMTLPAALLARFVETELRFGLRNPVMQMITNTFSKETRIRVRAWTLGILIPIGTLSASGLMGWLLHVEFGRLIPLVGLAAAISFVFAAHAVKRSLEKLPIREVEVSSRPPHGNQLGRVDMRPDHVGS